MAAAAPAARAQTMREKTLDRIASRPSSVPGAADPTPDEKNAKMFQLKQSLAAHAPSTSLSRVNGYNAEVNVGQKLRKVKVWSNQISQFGLIPGQLQQAMTTVQCWPHIASIGKLSDAARAISEAKVELEDDFVFPGTDAPENHSMLPGEVAFRLDNASFREEEEKKRGVLRGAGMSGSLIVRTSLNGLTWKEACEAIAMVTIQGDGFNAIKWMAAPSGEHGVAGTLTGTPQTWNTSRTWVPEVGQLFAMGPPDIARDAKTGVIIPAVSTRDSKAKGKFLLQPYPVQPFSFVHALHASVVRCPWVWAGFPSNPFRVYNESKGKATDRIDFAKATKADFSKVTLANADWNRTLPEIEDSIFRSITVEHAVSRSVAYANLVGIFALMIRIIGLSETDRSQMASVLTGGIDVSGDMGLFTLYQLFTSNLQKFKKMKDSFETAIKGAAVDHAEALMLAQSSSGESLRSYMATNPSATSAAAASGYNPPAGSGGRKGKKGKSSLPPRQSVPSVQSGGSILAPADTDVSAPDTASGAAAPAVRFESDEAPAAEASDVKGVSAPPTSGSGGSGRASTGILDLVWNRVRFSRAAIGLQDFLMRTIRGLVETQTLSVYGKVLERGQSGTGFIYQKS